MKGGGRWRRLDLRPSSLIRIEPWHRFKVGLGLLGGVLLFGTVGYVIIGLSPFDALYQTGITVTTVGYGEIGPSEKVGGAYRAFTLVIVLVGASSVLYVVSVLLETVVEGSLNDGLRRRRMLKQIDHMKGHIIVAGYGRVGHAIAGHAIQVGTAAVVVDRVASDTDHGVPMVVGDANDDDVLLAAGIERASSLVAALSSDPENLSLTLTARSLRSDLLIVARVADQRNERKFRRAGADRVVNPYEIGGARMGALAVQPHAAQFLEQVLADTTYDTDLYEVEIPEGSSAVGACLAEVVIGEDRALVVAVHGADGRFVTNPSPARRLVDGDTLIALGSRAQLELLKAQVAGDSKAKAGPHGARVPPPR